ncbi:MAG: ammonium transporter [Thermaurantimonas sp.]|uniref:ammonium transporter n=1 Tax=Thermaurantimonas sp. TaxID=2681568 RepID=UPI00391A27EF
MSEKRKLLVVRSIVFLLFTIAALAAILPTPHPEGEYTATTGDLAWMITSAGLVLLMTPGLSFFYGGMVRPKNIISTLLQSFMALGVITFLWYAVGFSLAFGDSIGGFIGNPFTYAFFRNVGTEQHPVLGSGLPFVLFAAFQMKFAIITPALITGSFAERIRFWAYLVFMMLFSLLVYCPLAHWTWHPDGFLAKWGVLDFAGGTVVHISAGVAALAGAIHMGPRRDTTPAPINIPYVILGTGLLWFGWFGFNSGSALGANALAVDAFINTHLASASALIGWVLTDVYRGRKISALGACIGAVVGLVAITPAAGFVGYGASLFIGFTSAIISNYAVRRRERSSLDDTLDVFPCHGVGGISGMIFTAVFAREGGLITGSTMLFFAHLASLVVVIAFVFGVSWLLYKLTERIIPMRVTEAQEIDGLDITQHRESVLF